MKISFLTLYPFVFGMMVFLLLPSELPKTMGSLMTERDNEEPKTGIIPIIENVGQFGTGALFQTDSEIGTMFLAKDALWLTILEPSPVIVGRDLFNESEVREPRGGVHLRISFVGSNPNSIIERLEPLTASINYFQGDDPTQWKTDVPVWGAVRYVDIYPGIDLEVSSEDGIPISRFVIQDSLRANLQDITLKIEGAESVAAGEVGIQIATEFGNYTLPYFKVVDTKRTALIGMPTQLNHETIQFPLTRMSLLPLPHPSGNPLLPSNLHYATFLGGSSRDVALATEVDANGSIILAGYTESIDFPTTPGAFDPSTGGNFPHDGFVTKFDPSGTTLLYSTYLQGNNTDDVYALEVDAEGNVYATGYTRSNNFPTTPNSPTPGFGGQADAFVLKLTPMGNTLLYGILLGGSEVDFARDIALMPDGSVVIAGVESGLGFPVTPGAYDTNSSADIRKAFVTHIAMDGSSLLYSTLLGGSFRTDGYGVAVDSQGSAYVMGITDSNDFPTTPGSYDPTPISLSQYFVTKFTPDGSGLVYSTVVGGRSTYLSTNDITVDQYGAAYVAAHVRSPSFPATTGAYDTQCGYQGMGCGNPQNSTDGILFKLNPAGSEMVYGTYLGGSGNDSARQVVVDDDGNAYVLGGMNSPEVQMSAGAYNYPNSVSTIWKINADGSELLQLSRCYVGTSLVLQADDVAICGGYSFGESETTPNGYDTTPNGDADATVARILLPAPATTTTLSVSGGGLSSNVDGTTYNFPANVFTETVVFTHAPRHPLSLPPVAPRITIGHTFVNYAIGGNGALDPSQPYELQIQYDESNPGIEETTLQLFYWNGTAWEAEPTTVLDPTNNLITATPSRLGWWVVTGAPHRRYLPLIKH